MKLALYSGGYFDENEAMNQQVVDLLESDRPTMTYIPAAFDHGTSEYEQFIDHFSTLGVHYFNIFYADKPFTKRELNRVLDSDAIFLSGGNTFYFLHHLRRARLIHHFWQYVMHDGGMLMGESAGSIIMTPNIRTASYPEFDCDDNDIGLTDWQAMGLVPFEFFPHYEPAPEYDDELCFQSRSLDQPIYAAPDGCGIIIDHDRMIFQGQMYAFIGGRSVLIHNPE